MFAVALLEDDDDLRTVLQEAFELLGVEHVVAADSLKQLQTASPRALECQAAVLDVNLGAGMPTGIDAARWLRSEGFAGRIVFLTGHAASFPDVNRLCQEPETVLLKKPMEIEQLVRALGVRPT